MLNLERRIRVTGFLPEKDGLSMGGLIEWRVKARAFQGQGSWRSLLAMKWAKAVG